MTNLSEHAPDNITVPIKELQDYEAAILAFLAAAHVIAAKLSHEGHALAVPLKTELRKAVMAQGSWRAAKWIATAAQQQGGRP
jgi:hypothetical protein